MTRSRESIDAVSGTVREIRRSQSRQSVGAIVQVGVAGLIIAAAVIGGGIWAIMSTLPENAEYTLLDETRALIGAIAISSAVIIMIKIIISCIHYALGRVEDYHRLLIDHVYALQSDFEDGTISESEAQEELHDIVLMCQK